MNTIDYTINGDLSPLEELQSCYGLGFNIIFKHGYKENDPGCMGQVIKFPLEPKLHSFMVDLGYKASPLSSCPPTLSKVSMSSSSCEQSNVSRQKKELLLAPQSLSNQELVFFRPFKAHFITLPPSTQKKFNNNGREKHSFYTCHQVLGHSNSECKALKDKIQQLHQLDFINPSSTNMSPSSSLNNKLY